MVDTHFWKFWKNQQLLLVSDQKLLLLLLLLLLFIIAVIIIVVVVFLYQNTFTVDVFKMFTKSFTEHHSIIFHQIREHELVTSVEDYNVLMLTSCRFVDCHGKVVDNLE